MTPAKLREALGVSRQGTLDLLRPLMEAGLVVREGTSRSIHYRLA
jgi:predicted HTH transcriptional regulator